MFEKIKQLKPKKIFIFGTIIVFIFLIGGILLFSKNNLQTIIRATERVGDNIEQLRKEFINKMTEEANRVFREGKYKTGKFEWDKGTATETQECKDQKECEEEEKMKAAWDVCGTLLRWLRPNENPFEICEPYHKADTLANEGKFDEAITFLEEKIKQFPESRNLHKKLAEILWDFYRKNKNPVILERAIKEAETTLDIDLSFEVPDYHITDLLSDLLVEAKDVKTIDRIFEKVFAFTHELMFYEDYVYVLIGIGDPRAEEAVLKAFERGSWDAVLKYAEYLLDHNQEEKVLNLPTFNWPKMYFYRGVAFERLNRLEEARTEYKKYRDYFGEECKDTPPELDVCKYVNLCKNEPETEICKSLGQEFLSQGEIICKSEAEEAKIECFRKRRDPMPLRFKIPGSKLQEEMEILFEGERSQIPSQEITDRQAIAGLSYLIWGEARGEAVGGMRAIGWIVRNRVLRGSIGPNNCYLSITNEGIKLADKYRSVMCQNNQFDGMCKYWCEDPNTTTCRYTTSTYQVAKDVYYGEDPDPVGVYCPGGIVNWNENECFEGIQHCYCHQETKCYDHYQDTFKLAGALLNFGTSTDCPLKHPGLSCGPNGVGKICGNGRLDNCFYPYPLYCVGFGCASTTGSISEPGEWYFTSPFYISNSGYLKGHLEGPEAIYNLIDFDLYLFKQIGNYWQIVDSSIRYGSVDDINYYGTPGYYIWGIQAFAGNGNFVLYTFTPNMTNSPIADALISTSSYCTVGPGLGQITFSWLYQDPNNDPQSQYWLQVGTDPQFNNLAVDCTSSQSVNPGQRGSATVRVTQSPRRTCQPMGEIAYNTTYYWRVKVRDSGQPPLWSEEWATGTSFDTITHPKPWPEFTWTPEIPFPADWIDFDPSSSTVYNGLSIVDWVFSGDPLYPRITTTTLGIVLNAYRTEGSKDVTLTITDTSGYSCSLTQTIGIAQQVPRNPRRYEPRE